MAVAALDMIGANPWSRVSMSEHTSLHGLRENIRRYLRAVRTAAKCPLTRPSRASMKAAG